MAIVAFKDYDNPELLRSVQRAQTKILEEFDRLCRQLEIPYAVYGGTAIGAVRHGGFIPWDDDTDVCLTRQDYERFLREAPPLMGDEFALNNLRLMDDFPYMYTKMVLKGTKFVHEWAKEATYQLPLSLDVFPLDELAPTKREFRKQSRDTWFWGRLLFLHGTPRPYLEVQGPIRPLIFAATTVVHKALHTLGIKQKWIQGQWEKSARRFEGSGAPAMSDFTMMDPLTWVVTADDLFPTIDVPFEDITVALPKEYDKVLTRGYGTYMELPPVEKRKNHQPYLVELGRHREMG